MIEDCVFCRIVKKLEQSWIVYENDLVTAFLDTNPVSEGHTLIIPRVKDKKFGAYCTKRKHHEGR